LSADRATSDARRERPFGVDFSVAVFDRATRLAASLIPGGFCLIVLVQDGVAWRSRPLGDAPIDAEDRAANLVMASGELLWVEDGRLDPRFANEPLVTAAPFLRAWIGQPIRLEDGSIPGVLVVAHTEPQRFVPRLASRLQDVADFVADEWARAKARQAQAEATQALGTMHSRLSALAESMPIVMVMTDPSLRIVAASRAFQRAMGLGADEWIAGRRLQDLTPNFEWIHAQCERSLAGESVSGPPLPLIGGEDARTAWMQVHTIPWRDASGAIGGIVVTASDVTELKAALTAAERSQERLSMALMLADVHVWEIDFARRALFKAGAEDTFFDPPRTYDNLYRDVFVAIDPRDRDVVREAWRRHGEEGVPYRPHYRTSRADGREVWAEGVTELFSDADGRPQRLLGAMRNITEDKHAQGRLIAAIEASQAANTAKSQFLATMSHEIRTPLNGVLGMAQAMEADELSEAQRARLTIIRESGQSLLAILNDVLDISKIEAGKLALESAPFDLAEVANSTRHAFDALAEGKGVALSLEITPAARGGCVGDAVRVRQVLSNLVSNALKFTAAGRVAVRVSRRGERVRIEVSDTGIGIAPADMQRLFEKFEQADASTTRRYGGSGLGLAICRELAELMGGRVEARSEAGVGSTFTVVLRLPRAADEESHAAPSPQAAPGELDPERPLRLLAAEDNEVNQLVLKTLLAQLGVEPVIVGDGEAAIAAFEAAEWDAILMDVQMPRVDGPTATRIIRQLEAASGRPRTPIIALTANAMAHQAQAYFDAGMDGFVAKPIEVGQLFAALQRALEPAAEAEEHRQQA
jgi:PAS domain S-box-containing protein